MNYLSFYSILTSPAEEKEMAGESKSPSAIETAYKYTGRRFRRLLLLTLAVLLFGLIAEARDYRVQATVTDSLGEPMEFVTWRLFDRADSLKALTSGITAVDGKINAKAVKPGEYRLSLTSMEIAPVTVNLTLTEDHPVAELGKIKTGNRELGEVVITAQRPLVVREIDRIGYDVKADEEAAVTTIDNILRKVPMVSVDDDGTVRVNGQTNFKIYKNGRPNKAYTTNSKEIFKTLPASAIKKIEVITDPGAREDAEGSSMILNIVTDNEMALKGVAGNLNTGISAKGPDAQLGGFLMGQIDKVTMSFYGGAFGSSWGRKSRSVSDGLFEETGTRTHSENLTDYKSLYSYFSGEMSYEMDTLNLFTGEFQWSGSSYKSKSESFEEYLNPDGSEMYSYKGKEKSPTNGYNYIDGNFNYQHSTHLKGETLTLSYMINVYNNRSRSNTDYFDIYNPPMEYTGIKSKNRQNSSEHTGQFDWSRPIGEKIKFDTGLKYIYRDNNSRSDRNYLGQPAMDTNDDFSHITNVGAIYTDWRFKFGKFGARAGIRYEYSRMEAKFHKGNHKNYHSDFNDWVPNVSADYEINASNSVKVSFNRRIERPDIYSLDPSEVVTPQSTSTGNPYLKSNYSSTLFAEYNIIKPKYNINVNVGYTFSDDGVLNVMDVVDDYIYSRPENIGKRKELFASFYGRISFGSKTSLSGYFQYSLDKLEDPRKHISITRPSGYFSLHLQQTLPWKIKGRLSMFYYHGSPTLYSYSKFARASLRTNISFMKSFLKEDRMTVMLGVQNPFGPFRNSMVSKNVGVNSSYKTMSRYYRVRGNFDVFLNVSIRFGTQKAFVKKTERSITNDDVERKNSGGSGGGM